jgi:hypothetical protein
MPTGGMNSFLLSASLGGLAILAHLKKLNAEHRSSYHAMRLIYQHAPRLREHLTRRFVRDGDLRVTKSERGGRDSADILPLQLGLDREGSGQRWAISELLERGRNYAVGVGQLRPSPEQCIAAGLFDAARQNPLPPHTLSEPQARALIRLALFDLGPGDPVESEAKALVAERLLTAIERHQNDDTRTFEKWFLEERDNLIHQIAKQKKGAGTLPREVVRQGIVELVWDSYGYMADCICIQMQAILKTLPSPLDHQERSLFELLYFKQPFLGGLPLVILHERFSILRYALADMTDHPSDSNRLGALLRLLQFYGEMVAARRDVDRSFKQRRHHRNVNGDVSRTVRLGSDFAGEHEPGRNEPFRLIVNQLRRDRELGCGCNGNEPWEAWTNSAPEDDPLSITTVCAKCHQDLTLVVSRVDFERVGRTVLANDVGEFRQAERELGEGVDE